MEGLVVVVVKRKSVLTVVETLDHKLLVI